MTLRVSGKNFNIGEALRQHVLEKIETATGKYFDGHVSGHVTIDHEGSGYRADCTLHLASGITLQAEGRAQEPYASFDQAAERLDKRLRRYKRRLKEHHGNGNQAANDEMFSSYVLQAPDVEDEEPTDFNPIVVAEQTGALKTMAVSAAVIELDMTGAPVVVFRHAGSGRVNFVYRRSDGNIGWIDPSVADDKRKQVKTS